MPKGDSIELTTYEQTKAAAILTVYMNMGGQLEWLPAKVKYSSLLKKCADHVDVEEDEDFTEPARKASSMAEPRFNAASLDWVKKNVFF